MEQKSEPGIRPAYSQLTSDKRTKTTQQRKDSDFNKWCWNNWTSTTKSKSRQRPYPSPELTANGSDINVKQKTIKFLGDNIGENLDDLGYSRTF